MSPILSVTAPVKLPRLWPKNSLSMSSEGIAPQFTGTNGPFGARPGAVDHARHQFLAGARFTGDVHRRLAARHAQDHLAQPFHRGRVADELRAGARRQRPRPESCESFSAVDDDAPQHAEVERLGHEIEGAEFQRAHRRLDVAMRGDDGAGHARALRRHPLEQVEAVAIRQAHVGQAQIEASAT